jgi:hypothetical protein
MKETSFQNAGTYQRSKQGFGVTVSDSHGWCDKDVISGEE